MNTEKQFLSEHDVSRYLNVSVHTLRMWRVKRIGPPYYKLGKVVRYGLADLQDWLKEQVIKSAKKQGVNL